MLARVCSICGDDPICTMAMFSDNLFVDGKKHDVVCHRCFSTLLTYEIINGITLCYKHLSPYYLNNVSTMMKYGWSEDEANVSLKAMNKCLDKLIKATPFGGHHISEALYLGAEVEVEGWPDDIKLNIS